MGSRTNRAIDLAIEKKLLAGLTANSARNQLSKLANYSAVKKYNAFRHAGFITDIIGINAIVEQRDNYNNHVCNFLDYGFAKTQSKFNILRLFKPGEILNTVIGVC